MPSIPIYPGAQAVRVEVIPRSKSKIGIASQITSFQANDPPNKIVGYYKDLLSKDGWHFNTPLTPEPNTIYAGKSPGVGSKDPVYGLRIDAKEGSGGMTEVKLDIGEYLYH